MRSKKFVGVMVLVMLLSALGSEVPVSADSVSDLQQQYASLQTQESNLQKQLQQEQANISNLTTVIGMLNQQISDVSTQISNLNTQISSTQAMVAQKESRISNLNSQIAKDTSLFHARLKAMYMNGNQTYLNVILNSNSVSDFLNRKEMVSALSKHDTDVINELSSASKEVQKDKQELSSALDKLTAQQGEISAKQSTLNAQKAQVSQLLALSQSNTASLQAQNASVLAQASQTDDQLNAEIAQEAAQASAQIAALRAASLKSAIQLTPQTATGAVAYMLSYANTYVGFPYRMGTAGPLIFDCSGLVQWVFANTRGIALPHSAAQQSTMGSLVDISDIQPGDLIFFNVDGTGVDHVGIYEGSGIMINAENPSAGVKLDNPFSSYWVGKIACVRRF